MVVLSDNNNVISVQAHLQAGKSSNAITQEVSSNKMANEARTSSKNKRMARGGPPEYVTPPWILKNSTAASPILGQASIRVGTLALVPTTLSSYPDLTKPAQKTSALSPSRRSTQVAQTSLIVQLFKPVQRTNSPLSASAPIVTILAESSQTFITSRQTPPTVTPLAKPNNAPAAVAARPLPGKNQPKPVWDAAAPAPFMPLSRLESTLASTASQPVSQLRATPSSVSLSIGAQSSSLASFGSLLDTTLTRSPSQASFTTLTKSQQGKEQASIPFSTSPTPKAVSVTRSLSTLLSSALGATSIMIVPTAPPGSLAIANSQFQRASRLTPLARTLFIVLGALGAVAILIAFGVILIMRSKQKRSRTVHLEPYDGVIEQPTSPTIYSVAIQTKSNNSVNDDPFLTESEKAIVMRATSLDGEPDAASSFKDAINAFIAKSRRLTYKISP